ncbi:Glycyl-tRNA synthetase, partial [Fasciola gigantica]
VTEWSSFLYSTTFCCTSVHQSHLPTHTIVHIIADALTRVGVTHRIDESSGSIGRRYARTDQIAIPYGITIDFDTINKRPASATLRERDSMKQIRVPILELPALVSELSNGLLDWTEAQVKYPAFEQQETVQREDSIPNQFVEEESKSPLISPQIQDVVDSNASPILAARVDDWQSVSEGVESEEEKQRPTLQSVPLGSQLVASEDLTTSTDSVPIQGRVTTVAGKVSPVSYQPKRELHEFVNENSLTKSNEKRGHKHGHTYKSDEVDTSPTKNEISVVPLEEVHGMGTKISSGAKLPSTWADCAKAIRRHYQEEESREKQTEQAASVHKDTTAPTISPLEMEESRNSYSGYEADQEDNVVNKSTTIDQMSPMIPHSAEAPGETDFGSSAGTSLTEATVPSKPELPNHGLFIGDGWPGQKQAAVTQGSGGKQHESDAPASSSGWETTMSQVYEKTCEPEMWQMQLDHADQSVGLTQISYDPRAHPPVQMPLVSAESRPDETSASHTTRFDLSVNHGLFVGSGWPATKLPTASLEAKKKPDTSKDKELDTEQSIEQPPSPRKPSTVPERERSVSPHDTTVEQKPTTPTVPPSTIEFDDPLFGDFNNPSPGDMWEPAPENTTTILHTEPAPEPFWEPTDEKKNYVEADLGHASPTEQQHVPSAQAAEDAGIFDLSISASNMDTGVVESPSEEQTYPQIVPISGEQCVTNHMDASFEPTEPVHDKTESSQPSTEAKIKPIEETVEKPKSPKMVTSEPTQHVPHENGTSKSKNKRRRHRKKKTLS